MLKLIKEVILEIGGHLKKNAFVILLTMTITFNCALAYYNYVTLFNMIATLKQLQNKIEIHEIQRRKDITDIYSVLSDISDGIINNSKGIISLANKTIEIIKTIDYNDKKYQKIDNENIDKIKEANVRIINFTAGCQGSGTYIKHKNKYYILSCAHLVDYDPRIDEFPDIIYAELDNGEMYPLTLEKIDKDKDLALFKVDFDKGVSYLEISNEMPKEGSEILVIGNPDSLTDLVTNGTIAKVNKATYTITPIIFFGNSGGAVIYKNKVVGVVSQISTYINGWVVVNYGISVNLETIQEFLTYLK